MLVALMLSGADPSAAEMQLPFFKAGKHL